MRFHLMDFWIWNCIFHSCNIVTVIFNVHISSNQHIVQFLVSLFEHYARNYCITVFTILMSRYLPISMVTGKTCPSQLCNEMSNIFILVRSFWFRGVLLNAVPSNVCIQSYKRTYRKTRKISSSITHHDVNYVVLGNFQRWTFGTF